jgi:hypothetical protein
MVSTIGTLKIHGEQVGGTRVMLRLVVHHLLMTQEFAELPWTLAFPLFRLID